MNPETNSIEDYSYDLEGRNGRYIATWAGLRIKATVLSVEANRDHDLSAEVRWSSGRPTTEGHLLSGKVTLLSIQSKRTMAQSLSSREDSIDWIKVIEQFCYSLEQKERTGDPDILLTRIDVSARKKYLIEPLIEFNNSSVIFGEPGSGKSWFALYLALLASEGRSENGLLVQEPINVLYLDWETSLDELRTRMTMLRNGLGLEGDGNIRYRPQHLSVGKDKRQIMEIILERNINFVIIDSVGAASDGDPETADAALSLFGDLRRMGERGGITALCIDHVNKSGEWYGSVYKRAEARRVFHARRAEQRGDSSSINFGLFNVKSNNGPIIAPLGFEISFPGPEEVIVEQQLLEETSLEEHLSLYNRIVNVLRVGPMTPNDMAEELNVKLQAVRTQLTRGAMKFPPIFVRVLEEGTNRRTGAYDLSSTVKDTLSSNSHSSSGVSEPEGEDGWLIG